jgi:hypothetical protein
MGTPDEVVRGFAWWRAFTPAAVSRHAEGAVVEYLAYALRVEARLFASAPKASIAPIGPNRSADSEWLSAKMTRMPPLPARHFAPAKNEYLICN